VSEVGEVNGRWGKQRLSFLGHSVVVLYIGLMLFLVEQREEDDTFSLDAKPARSDVTRLQGC